MRLRRNPDVEKQHIEPYVHSTQRYSWDSAPETNNRVLAPSLSVISDLNSLQFKTNKRPDDPASKLNIGGFIDFVFNVIELFLASDTENLVVEVVLVLKSTPLI